MAVVIACFSFAIETRPNRKLESLQDSSTCKQIRVINLLPSIVDFFSLNHHHHLAQCQEEENISSKLGMVGLRDEREKLQQKNNIFNSTLDELIRKANNKRIALVMTSSLSLLHRSQDGSGEKFFGMVSRFILRALMMIGINWFITAILHNWIIIE